MSKITRRREFAASLVTSVALAPALAALSSRAAAAPAVGDDGLVKVRSAYPVPETVERLKADIAAKGILFFQAIDQQKLAADAGIALRPSTLITFGNPPLGAQFLTSNPYSGLDWPVRVLVLQEADGSVWAAWTDFAWIAKRHGITDRMEQFAKATGVVQSITSVIRN